MTIYYSKSTNGFYDSLISSEIPTDAIEITEKLHQSLILARSNGKIIEADKKGNPIAVDPTYTKEQIISQYEVAAQQNLDLVAKSWGYNSLLSAASYANSTNAQFKADADALIEWRDNYWAEAYTIEAGTLPATADAFVALLPAVPKKPVI